jgi:hypothetical protein
VEQYSPGCKPRESGIANDVNPEGVEQRHAC